MDVYHVWCNLEPGVGDLDFADSVRRYLDHLRSAGHLEAYRITRCKLGLRPPQLREFHITLEFADLEQLEKSFAAVAERRDPIEELHHRVNSKVQDVFFALYRDFPDEQRVRGEERF